MLLFIFPNSFKIQGHSNPKHKKAFERVKKTQTEKQLKNSRYSGNVSQQKRSEIRKNLDEQFRFARRSLPFQLAILLLFLGFLCFLGYGYGLYFIQNSNRPIKLISYYTESKPAIEQARETSYEIYSRLGKEAYQNGEREKAIAHFQKAFEDYPNGPRVILGFAKTYGDLCMMNNQYCEPARHWVSKAIQENLAPEKMRIYTRFLWRDGEE